jgi:hypothetical protein
VYYGIVLFSPDYFADLSSFSPAFFTMLTSLAEIPILVGGGILSLKYGYDVVCFLVLFCRWLMRPCQASRCDCCVFWRNVFCAAVHGVCAAGDAASRVGSTDGVVGCSRTQFCSVCSGCSFDYRMVGTKNLSCFLAFRHVPFFSLPPSYPTSCRASGFGFSNGASRIAGILTPWIAIPLKNIYVAIFIYAAFSMGAALLAFAFENKSGTDPLE